jgi:ABC transporter with metal-binding/Fe-S-binding domain ATP-binding protein
MKGISLLSGGKDSYMSLMIAMSVGMDIERTITVIPEEDSMMFHVPNAILGKAVSELSGIENTAVTEEEFYEEIKRYKGYSIVAGAVESEYQKTRLERMAYEIGMKTFFPLWRRNHLNIMHDFIKSGSKGIFVSVAAEGLDENFLGREIDEKSLSELVKLNIKYGISIVGEGGEYETLVTYNPFNDLCIEILEKEVIDRGMQKNLIVKRYSIHPFHQ